MDIDGDNVSMVDWIWRRTHLGDAVDNRRELGGVEGVCNLLDSGP